MDKHFVLSKIKDYEAHLDNVAPLMESDDQLIMNELIREINNTCHVKIRGFSDLCDSYIKGAWLDYCKAHQLLSFASHTFCLGFPFGRKQKA